MRSLLAHHHIFPAPAPRRIGRAAEKRIFIVANTPTATGSTVAWASGAKCGAAAAAAYWQIEGIRPGRIPFRQVDKDEITGAIPTNGGACKGSGCDQFVAIECTR